jgi:geranylgeranyl diphosphate synthase type I
MTASPNTVDRLQELREPLIRMLEQRWPAQAGRLNEILRHALLPAGKLLRPALLLESASLVGGDPEALTEVSLALEHLHVATLVHDDIIDGDLTRRGKPTVHARYGVPNGIIAGDALLFTMFETLTEQTGLVSADVLLAAVRVAARTGLELCEGQVEESLLVDNLHCGLDSYLRMASRKTGALFRCACEIGALLGGANPVELAALGAYADHLGRAFQMHDHLLPYTETAEETGKSAVSDVLNRRPTLPILIGMELAGPAEQDVIQDALSGRQLPEQAHQQLINVLTALGALDAARERTRAEADAAKQSLAGFAGADTTMLGCVADLVVERSW